MLFSSLKKFIFPTIIIILFLFLLLLKKDENNLSYIDIKTSYKTVTEYYNAINNDNGYSLSNMYSENSPHKDKNKFYCNYNIFNIRYEPKDISYKYAYNYMAKISNSDMDEKFYKWIYIKIDFIPNKKENSSSADGFEDGRLYEDWGIYLVKTNMFGKWKVLDYGY